MVEGKRYFLFPLQLSGDYQIRSHSPFLSMTMALEYVLTSFARHAPPDAILLVKEHPLDVGFPQLAPPYPPTQCAHITA